MKMPRTCCLALALCAVGIAAACGLYWYLLVGQVIFGPYRKASLEEITTPVDTVVAQDVCRQLDLPQTDKRCQPGAVVYAPEFFGAIQAAFPVGKATYADVEEKFGRYRYKCEDPVYTQSDNSVTYRCSYDLRGDRVSIFTFVFRNDHVVEQFLFSGYDL